MLTTVTVVSRTMRAMILVPQDDGPHPEDDSPHPEDDGPRPLTNAQTSEPGLFGGVYAIFYYAQGANLLNFQSYLVIT